MRPQGLPITPLQQRLIDLDLEYETVIKDFYERREAAYTQAQEELKAGEMWQDPRDGVVYRWAAAAGQWVSNRTHQLERTRRGYLGEARAAHAVSKKDAEAAGFDLGDSYPLRDE